MHRIIKKFRTFATRMQKAYHKQQPLVTFIIAYYELPIKMLHECLDSIYALSLYPKEREIIVIDDGSKESVMPQLGDYAELIYIRKNHAGLSEARNTGIRMATGDYIQFVDADDQLITTPYDHCLDIARFNHPDVVMFDFTRTTPKKRLYNDTPVQSGTDYMRNNNIHGTACGYLFRRTILGDLHFTSGIYHEDEEFTPLLLIRAESVIVSDAKAYLYTDRPSSIITSKDKPHIEKRLADTLLVIRHLHELASQLPSNDLLAMERRVAQLTMDYIYNVILQTRSLTRTQEKLNELRSYRLFPLPDRNYTKKYQWFRRMTGNSIGLSVLVIALPFMKIER